MTENNGNGRVRHLIEKLLPYAVLGLFALYVRVEVFMGQGDRFTPKDAENLAASMREHIASEIGTLPPIWFRNNVEELKADVKANSKAIGELHVEMNGRLRAIEALLRDG